MHTCVHYIPDTGQIAMLIRGENPAQIELGDGHVSLMLASPKDVNHRLDYVLNGEVIPRPRIALVLPTLVGEALDFGTLPAGTKATLTNEAGDQMAITNLGETVVLTDAGAYQIELSPPFPWIKETLTLEVSNG